MDYFCSHLVPNLNAKKVGKVRYHQCKQPAPELFFYDGKDKLPLCSQHADEYAQLNLTIQHR